MKDGLIGLSLSPSSLTRASAAMTAERGLSTWGCAWSIACWRESLSLAVCECDSRSAWELDGDAADDPDSCAGEAPWPSAFLSGSSLRRSSLVMTRVVLLFGVVWGFCLSRARAC